MSSLSEASKERITIIGGRKRIKKIIFCRRGRRDDVKCSIEDWEEVKNIWRVAIKEENLRIGKKRIVWRKLMLKSYRSEKKT